MGALTDWQIERDVKITPFAPAQKRPGVISYGVSSMGYDVRLGYKFKVFQPFPPGVIDAKNFNQAHLRDVDLSPVPHRFIPSKDNCGQLDGMDGYCQHCRLRLKTTDDTPCSRSPNPYIDIPPYSFVLGESLEHFNIPRDILVLVVGKSTYARCGLIVNVTPGEPEWPGYWTIELTNPTPLPMRVYCGEGIMQCVFLRSDARYELALGAVADLFTNLVGADRNNDQENSDTLAMLRRLVLRIPPDEGKLEGTCTTSYLDKKGKYTNQPGLTVPEVDRAFLNIPIKTDAPPGPQTQDVPDPGPDQDTPPPANAPTDKPWKNPKTGALWRYNEHRTLWVQVTEGKK